MDLGFGDIETLFVIPDERRHLVSQPKVRSATQRRGNTLKPGSWSQRRTIASTKSRVGAGVEQLCAGVSTISEQMLEPGPALTDGGHNLLGPDAVGNVCRGQIQYYEATIRFQRIMPYASFDPLSDIIPAATFGRKCWNRSRSSSVRSAGRHLVFLAFSVIRPWFSAVHI